jgi:hypothetical protein
VRSATSTGIDVWGDVNRIVQNVVSDIVAAGSAGGDGIVVHGARSLVSGNLSEKNTGCGLVFQSFAVDNGYSNNMLRDNLGSCVLGVKDLGANDTNAGGNL